MAQIKNDGNELIDFNHTNVNNESSGDMDSKKSSTAETSNERLPTKQELVDFFCSSQPLCESLTESKNIDKNNPFD